MIFVGTGLRVQSRSLDLVISDAIDAGINCMKNVSALYEDSVMLEKPEDSRKFEEL